jgi:hypothetical protein
VRTLVPIIFSVIVIGGIAASFIAGGVLRMSARRKAMRGGAGYGNWPGDQGPFGPTGGPRGGSPGGHRGGHHGGGHQGGWTGGGHGGGHHGGGWSGGGHSGGGGGGGDGGGGHHH